MAIRGPAQGRASISQAGQPQGPREFALHRAVSMGMALALMEYSE